MNKRPIHYLVLLILLSTTSCNIFDPLDSPTGDAQILSAARACFDRGDIACAKDLYSKLSTDEADTAAAETAFAILDENGVSMQVFMDSLGDLNGAKAINSLAAKLKGRASTTHRLAIYESYKKVASINSRTELRGLVRFISAFALISSIFAEKTESDGILRKSDIVKTPTSCTKETCATTNIVNCGVPTGDKVGTGAEVNLIDSPLTADLTGSPTLGMIVGATRAIDRALSIEIAAGGKFDSSTGTLFSDLIKAFTDAGVAGDPCFRSVLIDLGVGSN